MGIFDRPMSAGPADQVIGYDELGRPVMRSLLGVDYGAAYAEPAAPRAAPIQGRAERARASRDAVLGGLLGVVQGFTAPGRAARGEPVTLGDAWATALDYGLLGAPMQAPQGAVRSGAMRDRPGIRAYHGSPHDFDRFDMSKIGTGEGAQAYGHGLYFAESEDVARSYRANNSASAKMRYNGKPIKDEIRQSVAWHIDNKGYDKAAVRSEWLEQYKPEFWETALGKRMMRELDRMDPEKIRAGRMYEVRINASPDDFLDWDAPLSGQGPKVREALSGFNLTTEIKDGMSLMPGAKLRIEVDPSLPEYPRYFMEMDNGQRFRLQPDDLKNMVAQAKEEIRGNNVVSTIANQIGGESAATNALRDAGIPGIKYLDAGSRGAGDGSRNFVVFDDNLIEIVRKYGVAGAAIMLGVSTQEVQQAMQSDQPRGLLQ